MRSITSLSTLSMARMNSSSAGWRHSTNSWTRMTTPQCGLHSGAMTSWSIRAKARVVRRLMNCWIKSSTCFWERTGATSSSSSSPNCCHRGWSIVNQPMILKKRVWFLSWNNMLDRLVWVSWSLWRMIWGRVRNYGMILWYQVMMSRIRMKFKSGCWQKLSGL